VPQAFRAYLVHHDLRSDSVYGIFATVLGLVAWIYLAAEAAEVNVVLARKLWPRKPGQPAFRTTYWVTEPGSTEMPDRAASTIRSAWVLRAASVITRPVANVLPELPAGSRSVTLVAKAGLRYPRNPPANRG
jgi:hypothetical protein